jgi:energy-coupling factor transporter ATP-binding protein EcfA2
MSLKIREGEKILLNTGAKESALRRSKRDNTPGTENISKYQKEASDTIRDLKSLGYTEKSPRQIMEKLRSRAPDKSSLARYGAATDKEREKGRVVYHGTVASDITSMEPKAHPLVKGKKVVFATPDRKFAISMAIPEATERDIAVGYFKDTKTGKKDFYVDELKPGAFKVLDKPAYLYTLSAKGFNTDARLMPEEVVSEEPASILRKERIGNVLAELRRDANVKLIGYDSVPDSLGKRKHTEGAQTPDKTKWDKVSRKGEDVYVYTAIPRDSRKLVDRYGLMSGKNVARNPEVLAAARLTNKEREEFKESIDKKLGTWREDSVSGPSVFFTFPDWGKIHKQHYINKWNLSPARVNLSKLMREEPGTRIRGSELVPYDRAWSKLSDKEYKALGIKRHRDLTLEEVGEYTKKSPKELWKHYDSPKGTHYASDVPHAMVITTSGNIHPRYIEHLDEWVGKGRDVPHVLVTGHSGAGKSTLAKEMAEKAVMPLYQLDKDPAFAKALSDKKLMDVTRKHRREGLAGLSPLDSIRRDILLRALKQKSPHIIEGSQVLVDPELTEGYRRILVDTPKGQIIKQRVRREYLRADREPRWKKDEGTEVARKLMSSHQEEIAAFRKSPGVEVVKMKRKKDNRVSGYYRNGRYIKPYFRGEVAANKARKVTGKKKIACITEAERLLIALITG